MNSHGGLFGSGIYLADMFAKAFNYSYDSFNRSNEAKLILIWEAAIGK